MIDCADHNKVKIPERGARTQEVVSPTKKFEDKDEKEREQHKKKAEKETMKNSLKSLTGDDLEDALDRLMT